MSFDPCASELVTIQREGQWLPMIWGMGGAETLLKLAFLPSVLFRQPWTLHTCGFPWLPTWEVETFFMVYKLEASFCGPSGRNYDVEAPTFQTPALSKGGWKVQIAAPSKGKEADALEPS